MADEIVRDAYDAVANDHAASNSPRAARLVHHGGTPAANPEASSRSDTVPAHSRTTTMR